MDLERLETLRTNVSLAQGEIARQLVGDRIRFKAWLLNGKQRTGTITDAAAYGNHITIGVAVDREDGRPGVLLDTWWGSLNAVED